jgi:hypothetical protein
MGELSAAFAPFGLDASGVFIIVRNHADIDIIYR